MKSSFVNWPQRLGLRVGDWVVVRSREEILSTLDNCARFENLPFQPEMLAFCGRRMRVAKVAHKTCDTAKKTGGRRMMNAVHLEGARCDGGGHDDCQADCVFFWKEVWLRREVDRSEVRLPTGGPRATVEDVVKAARSLEEPPSDDPTWVCQTTAIHDATTPLKWWDVRQYVRDVTSGNHSAWHMIRLLTAAGYRNLVGLGVGWKMLVGLYDWFQRMRDGQPFPVMVGRISEGQPTPTAMLNLQPGEWVEVKSPDEIMQTITVRGFNRGMRYDMEMLKYSGKRYRVQMRVSKIVHEQTGKMVYMKTPCIQLEDVYCRAECTARRLGCPRASNTYWREIWLKRVDGPDGNESR